MKRFLRTMALALTLALCLGALAMPALASGSVQATAPVNVRYGPGLDYGVVGSLKTGGSRASLDAKQYDDRNVLWYKVQFDKYNVGWVSSTYAKLVQGSSGQATGQYVKATDGSTVLRSGPGLTYKFLATIFQGDTATYLNQSSVDDRGVTWYYVTYNGKTGWVSSKYTTLTGGGSGGKATGDTVTATGGASFLRSGPGLDYALLATMKQGESATYLNKSSVDDRGVTWYYVNFKGQTGWVSSKYTSLGSGKSGGGSSGGSGGSGSSVKATGSTNVRANPNVNAKIIGTLYSGQKVTYLNQTSTDDRGVLWYKVQDASFGTGWVSSKYTEVTGSGSGGKSSSKSGSYVEATGGKSNLRSGPGLDYKDVGTMYKGETATFLGSTSTDDRGVKWYKINYNGMVCWVSSKYTTLY